MKHGLIHIYSGEGKGKTTASVGLAVRALSHGLNVAYSSFFKHPNQTGYNEIIVLKNLGAKIFSFSEGMPMANPHITAKEYWISTNDGLKELLHFVTENKTQLLVLDEILIVISCNYLHEDELVEFIKDKPAELELVLTGRGATEKLIEVADYVTIFAKEKHPYDRGIQSRIGIEY